MKFRNQIRNFMKKYIVEHDICNTVDELKRSYKRISSLGHTVCIKPAMAHGSRGFRTIEPAVSKEDFFNCKPQKSSITLESLCRILSQGDSKFPDLIVMEHLPGEEYSVDCFEYKNDFLCITRRRDIIKDGICVAGTTIEKKELIAASKMLYDKLRLKYNANIQFKYDSNNNPKLLEINPRLSGTLELCRASGINFVEVAIKEILKKDSKFVYNIAWGTTMTRVWQEIFFHNNKMFTLGKIDAK